MTLQRVARALAAVAAVGFGYLAYEYLTLPDVRPLATANPSTTAFMELRADEARAAGKRVRHVQRWVGYSHVSLPLKRAVIVAEDDAFWQHEGVDFAQLEESLELDWARRQLVRGASTITQQLAKNLYLSPSRSPVRKFRELVIARRLEAELKKVRIFELYLNVIEWGDGVYGVEAASARVLLTARLVARRARSLPARWRDRESAPAQPRAPERKSHAASAADSSSPRSVDNGSAGSGSRGEVM